jgi:hypothetical protein
MGRANEEVLIDTANNPDLTSVRIDNDSRFEGY